MFTGWLRARRTWSPASAPSSARLGPARLHPAEVGSGEQGGASSSPSEKRRGGGGCTEQSCGIVPRGWGPEEGRAGEPEET